MQNVVSFQFHKLQKQCQHLHQLAMYWTGLNAGDVPRRSDLDPRDMQEFLPYIFVLDQHNEHDAMIRISSVVLDTLLGEDAKGVALKSFFAHVSYPKLKSALAALWQDHKPQAIEMRAILDNTNDDLRAVMVFFPLRDAFGRVTKAIGGIETQGRIKYPPYTFDITPFSSDLKFELVRQHYTALRPITGSGG